VFAAAFRREHLADDARLQVLCDPQGASYRALALTRGVWSILDPRVMARGLAAWRAGFRQAQVQGDPLQNGGVLVVNATGVICYRQASRFAGDHPDPHAVLRAVERCPLS
jgi:AhpC/TSA antioxidant enzyme